MTKARTNADNASADIQGVTAGTGLSGGGTSGTVTLTNDMATTINAAGDLLYGTANDAYTRLGIGTAGQYLSVNSGATAPEWTTLSAGGMTSLASGSLAASATGIDISSISSNYNELWLYVRNFSTALSVDAYIRTNNNSSSDYTYTFYSIGGGTWNSQQGLNQFGVVQGINTTQTGISAVFRFPDYKNTTGYKHIEWACANSDNTMFWGRGLTRSVSAINRISFISSSSSFDSGTYELFGVK